jgi:hypothetical protein
LDRRWRCHERRSRRLGLGRGWRPCVRGSNCLEREQPVGHGSRTIRAPKPREKTRRPERRRWRWIGGVRRTIRDLLVQGVCFQLQPGAIFQRGQKPTTPHHSAGRNLRPKVPPPAGHAVSLSRSGCDRRTSWLSCLCLAGRVVRQAVVPVPGGKRREARSEGHLQHDCGSNVIRDEVRRNPPGCQRLGWLPGRGRRESVLKVILELRRNHERQRLGWPKEIRELSLRPRSQEVGWT